MEGVSFEQHKTSRKKSSSKKKSDSSSGPSECAGQSKTKYLNADIPGPSKTKYLNSDVPGPSWYDPLSANMSPMKCPAPFEGTSDIACSLSTELEERLSMNSIADNVNGLVNGASSECVSKNCSTNENSSQQESSSEKQEVDNNVPKIPDQPIENLPPIQYMQYESELQMPLIMKIIQKDLSEPYSIYTYRYFIHNWPKLCFLAMCEGECVGAIVCKLDIHRKVVCRGYIAMLAVDQKYRRRSIGSTLVKQAIYEMIAGGADEVVLETEVTNKPALRLYEALGFVRDKRLFRYYLNGVDALRLKLWFR